jgi:hypothetical protein
VSDILPKDKPQSTKLMNFRDHLMYKYVFILQGRPVLLFKFHFRLKPASFFWCLEMSHDETISGVYRIISLLKTYKFCTIKGPKIILGYFQNYYVENFCLFFIWRDSPQWARASSFARFLDHTQRRTKVCRTPLDEWSARCRNIYLTTHNTHNRQTSMPLQGFEPTVLAGERFQTYALDRAATGTGYFPP